MIQCFLRHAQWNPSSIEDYGQNPIDFSNARTNGAAPCLPAASSGHSQNPGNLIPVLQFHPSHCQNQTQRGRQRIEMHKCQFVFFLFSMSGTKQSRQLRAEFSPCGLLPFRMVFSHSRISFSMSLPRKKEQLLTTTQDSYKVPVCSDLHAKSLKVFSLPLESKVYSDVRLCRVANILQPAEWALTTGWTGRSCSVFFVTMLWQCSDQTYAMWQCIRL